MTATEVTLNRRSARMKPAVIEGLQIDESEANAHYASMQGLTLSDADSLVMAAASLVKFTDLDRLTGIKVAINTVSASVGGLALVIGIVMGAYLAAFTGSLLIVASAYGQYVEARRK